MSFCKAHTGELNWDVIDTTTLAFFWFQVVAWIFAIPLRYEIVCDLISWLGKWRGGYFHLAFPNHDSCHFSGHSSTAVDVHFDDILRGQENDQGESVDVVGPLWAGLYPGLYLSPGPHNPSFQQGGHETASDLGTIVNSCPVSKSPQKIRLFLFLRV